MRFGRITWLVVGLLSFSVVGLSQPSEANAKHKKCAKHCSKACSKHACSKGCKNSIVDVATKDGSFKTLVADLKTAGLAKTLCGPGPFTVFAPSDAAFAKIAKNPLSSDPDKLAKVLKYHVVKGNHALADLLQKRSITTLEGESLMLEAKDQQLIVDGALVTKAPITCGNGTIYVIDTVLVPERGK